MGETQDHERERGTGKSESPLLSKTDNDRVPTETVGYTHTKARWTIVRTSVTEIIWDASRVQLTREEKEGSGTDSGKGRGWLWSKETQKRE